MRGNGQPEITPLQHGVLAGLADDDRWNPYDDYFEKYQHVAWANGYALGMRLLALLPEEVEA